MSRIAILLPYELGTIPSQRYRWEQWLPHLEAAGLQVEVVCCSTKAVGAARHAGRGLAAFALMALRYPVWLVQALRAGLRANLVVIHRNAALSGPPLAEMLLSLMGKRLVYELDDAIYLPPESGDTFWRRLVRCDWRAGMIGRRAAMVGAGNPTLGAHMAQYCHHVVIWPSTVDTGLYRAPMREGIAPPVIGWTGSRSTQQYLEPLLPQLAALQHEAPFEMLVIGAEIDLATHGLAGRCVPWSAETEVGLTGEIDIGLMPLPDTPWARGKCALKAIQYQALGAPAVVSDVGVTREVVIDGESGFVVAPGGDWPAPLRRLLEDADLRRRMGAAGRARVEAHYSARVVGQRVAADLSNLLT
ncbi:MAG: glycosyltransferase family 4 protein [Paracoccaceae bacterium]|nr:glycosyltransferase family 4 protein [Paracoccaceae bacterium]